MYEVCETCPIAKGGLTVAERERALIGLSLIFRGVYTGVEDYASDFDLSADQKQAMNGCLIAHQEGGDCGYIGD